MAQLSIKSGDSLIVDGWDGDIVLKFEHISGRHADVTVNALEDVSVKRGKKPKQDADVQCELNEIREEIVSLLSTMDAAASQEMLAQIVSDLFYAQAQMRQKEERRVKQAKGIAQAKAAGVQFGPERLPLPHGFEPIARKWHEGGISANQAAKQLGMNRDTFLRRARERYAESI